MYDKTNISSNEIAKLFHYYDKDKYIIKKNIYEHKSRNYIIKLNNDITLNWKSIKNEFVLEDYNIGEAEYYFVEL